MRDTVLSNCERNFILKAASELKRLDGRKLEGFRNLKIIFGRDWGLCYVALGETKVLTQVTCEIQEPKATKPNEGLLFINVELSSMASSNFEPGRASSLSVHINRLLEKCVKDSRAVDLESLCIVAEDKVWVLRVDVNILNHDGGLVDCASISVLAALAHFKRPDVTTDGNDITVHSIADRDPIPITLHHYPICVSFALLNNSENLFADPTAIEERVSDANLTFGINAYNEICCLHLGGTALIDKKIILTCSKKAAARSKDVVDIIKKALEKDAEIRQNKEKVGFVHVFEWDRITSLSEGRLQVQLSKFSLINQIPDVDVEDSNVKNEYFEVIDLGSNCAELNMKINKENSMPNSQVEHTNVSLNGKKNIEIKKSLTQIDEPKYGEGGSSKWDVDMNVVSVRKDSSDVIFDSEKSVKRVQSIKQIESIDLCDDGNDDEEEEEVVIVNMLEPLDTENKKTLAKEKGINSQQLQTLNEKSTKQGGGKSKKKKRNKK